MLYTITEHRDISVQNSGPQTDSSIQQEIKDRSVYNVRRHKFSYILLRIAGNRRSPCIVVLYTVGKSTGFPVYNIKYHLAYFGRPQESF